MNKQEILRMCESFDFSSYENIDLNRLALYGIWFLSEKSILTTYENLVVVLFRMFPKKYSLKGYDEYPDGLRVHMALFQLRPKYRNWATGDKQRGFVLTSTGKRILEQTKKLLENPDLQTDKVTKSPSKPRTKGDLEEKYNEILHSEIFKKYIEGDFTAINKMELFSLLKTVPYTPPKVLRSYLKNIEEIGKEYDDDKVIEFCKWLRKNFEEVFSD